QGALRQAHPGRASTGAERTSDGESCSAKSGLRLAQAAGQVAGNVSLVLNSLFSDPVKLPGVVAQNCRFVILLEVCALKDLIDFFHAVAKRNFVWEVGREHERRRADPLDCVCERFLISFTANENSPALKIIFRFSLEMQTAVFELAREAVNHDGNPRRPAFKKADS